MKGDKKTKEDKEVIRLIEEEIKKNGPQDTGAIGREGPEEEEPITDKVVEKPKEKSKPKPTPPPAKKVENRNVPCMLRFKKVTATQAANVVHLFKKSKYTDYTISHAKGHNMWDILVRFKNLDERAKFEKWINSLL